MRALETCLYADDLNAAEAFYSGVLGLELHSKVEGRHLFYRLEGSMLLIFNPVESARPGDVPPHAGTPGGHACLGIPREQTDEWEARLRAAGLEVTRYAWKDRGDSLYFHDPAGNVLELAPPGIWGIGHLGNTGGHEAPHDLPAGPAAVPAAVPAGVERRPTEIHPEARA